MGRKDSASIPQAHLEVPSLRRLMKVISHKKYATDFGMGERLGRMFQNLT